MLAVLKRGGPCTFADTSESKRTLRSAAPLLSWRRAQTLSRAFFQNLSIAGGKKAACPVGLQCQQVAVESAVRERGRNRWEEQIDYHLRGGQRTSGRDCARALKRA